MKILHHGAINGVTGSCHVLAVNKSTSVLIDCGLFQGEDSKADLAIEFDITNITALIVTHCHIDHVGRIPYLLSAGFKGPIYITQASASLLPLGMAGVNIAIPNLAEDLHASAKMIAWMPTLYLLSSVMFMLPCGKIADNYGRKRVYASGLALNALASLMCALATSIEWVLFGRFIQGAAGAMIFGIGVAIITSVTPDNKRGMALGTSAAYLLSVATLSSFLRGYTITPRIMQP